MERERGECDGQFGENLGWVERAAVLGPLFLHAYVFITEGVCRVVLLLFI